MSDKFIFDEVDGRIKFIGNFEGFYKSVGDPWGQSSLSDDKQMDEFYIRSRSNLLKRLKLIKPIINKAQPMIEIGCGLGYVVNLISTNLDINVIGLDISETAIEKAKFLFPNNQFIVHDISKEKKSFATPSVVILSNILWYILEDIETISKNIIHLFHPSNSYPKVIIQNAFFKGNQRYGKSICNGFEGGQLNYFI